MTSEERKRSNARHFDVRSFTPPCEGTDSAVIVKCDSVRAGKATVGVKRLKESSPKGLSSNGKRVKMNIIDERTIEYEAVKNTSYRGKNEKRVPLSESLDAHGPLSPERSNVYPAHDNKDTPTMSTMGSIVPICQIRSKKLRLRGKLRNSRGMKDHDLFKLILSMSTEFIHCLRNVSQADSPVKIAHTLMRRRELAVMSCRVTRASISIPKIGLLWKFSITRKRSV